MNDFHSLLRKNFPEYPIPSEILGERTGADCDSADAALLLGISWSRVDGEFWREYWSAASALSARAFVYYLPSMLEFSIADSNEMIRDYLIYILNTSGDEDGFSHSLSERMRLMNVDQIRCLSIWHDIMRELSYFSDSIDCERVAITILKFEELAQSQQG